MDLRLPLASARISGNSCVMAIDLNILLRAYAMGIFPMADGRDDPEIFWVEPKRRAILPLSGLHLSRSLRKTIRSDKFRVTADQRSEEHTSELQSLMRISYAVLRWKIEILHM